MDDGYGTCLYCRWWGKLRKDGAMRKHREAVDTPGRYGERHQERYGPVCAGSGQAVQLWRTDADGFTVPYQSDETEEQIMKLTNESDLCEITRSIRVTVGPVARG